MADTSDPKRFGIWSSNASPPVCARCSGVPVVNADRARAVGYDLKQAAGHDQVLNEMERLVGIGKICMKECRCSQAEQGQHSGDDARLITCNDKETTADLDGNSCGVRQRCRQWEHGGRN